MVTEHDNPGRLACGQRLLARQAFRATFSSTGGSAGVGNGVGAAATPTLTMVMEEKGGVNQILKKR